MPMSYVVDTERGLIRTRASGALEERDLVQYEAATEADARLCEEFDELIDAREVDVQGLSVEAIRRFSQFFVGARSAPHRRRVALVASSDLAFGLSRMFQTLRSDSKTDLRVFRELEPAEAWLDRAPT